MEDWKSLFQAHILARGLDYYKSEAVKDIERTETGYCATVEGTEDYEVEIEIRDGRICDMECSCPYAKGGSYCKHMAAVLYEIEESQEYEIEEEEVQEKPGKAWEEKYQDSRSELRSVIDGIPEEELRNLIEHMALENESLRNQILTRYSANISGKQMVRLKKEVGDIAYRYSDRSGFVDWRNAGGYISEMEAFLCDKVEAVIDKGCYMQAFELTNHVFVTVGNQDMDDSDGGTGMVADTCYEIWQKILEKCGEQDKEKMRVWFEKHQASGTVIDYMEEYIDEFLINELHDKDLLCKEMQVLDEQIEKRKESGSTVCGSCYSVRNGSENNILKRIQIMEALGASKEEILQYRKDNRGFAAVRMLEVEEYIQAGRHMDAIRVLKESKELDKESSGGVKDHSQKLIELYSQMGMDKEYKEELLFQVFSFSQNSLNFVMKLKAVCKQEEWEQYREKLLNGPTGYGISLSLMEAEKMYDRLLEEVINSGFASMLDQYEKVLKKIYPDRMRAAYIACVKKQVEAVSERKQYKELMWYLKKIASYPQGQDAARQLAREWRTVYKRRPAMMDELKRAGF